jgi:hypothetical protein
MVSVNVLGVKDCLLGTPIRIVTQLKNHFQVVAIITGDVAVNSR